MNKLLATVAVTAILASSAAFAQAPVDPAPIAAPAAEEAAPAKSDAAPTKKHKHHAKKGAHHHHKKKANKDAAPAGDTK